MTSTSSNTDAQSAFDGTLGALTGLGILTLALAPLSLPFLVLTAVFLAPLALPLLLVVPVALVWLFIRTGRRLVSRRREAAPATSARPRRGPQAVREPRALG